MVMPRRYGNSNVGHTGRHGIDQWTPETVYDASTLGATDALSRALAVMEHARPKWQRGPLPCKTNPTLFTSGKPADRSAAFTLCGTVCPRRQECLDFAIEMQDYTTVIYGGTDGAARKQLAKQRPKKETPDATP